MPRPFLLAHRPPSSPRRRSLVADLLRIATTKSGHQPDNGWNSKITPTPWPYLLAAPAGVRKEEGCSRYLTWPWCGRTELVSGNQLLQDESGMQSRLHMEASESSGAVRAARVLRVRARTHRHRQFFFSPPMHSPSLCSRGRGKA